MLKEWLILQRLLRGDIVAVKCEIIDCENDPDFIDGMGNFMCEECVIEDVENGDSEYEEYESININKTKPSQ